MSRTLEAANRHKASVARARSLLLIACVACAPAASEAQPRALDAITLRRVAEAVAGTSTGGEVYVVAEPAPNGVIEVFVTRREAEARLRRLRDRAHLLGPFSTSAPVSIAACTHFSGSRWRTEAQCPRPGRAVALSEVSRMTLLLTLRNGGRDSIPLPSDVDAIFLSMAAIDKFVIPYYAGVQGLAKANEIRQHAGQSFAPRR